MKPEEQQVANAANQGAANTGVPAEPPDHPQTGPDVTVTVDGKLQTIHRGSHLVSELKQLWNIDASRALDEVVGGEFKPLDDNARTTIKGGEIFVSHVREGGSSSNASPGTSRRAAGCL